MQSERTSGKWSGSEKFIMAPGPQTSCQTRFLFSEEAMSKSVENFGWLNPYQLVLCFYPWDWNQLGPVVGWAGEIFDLVGRLCLAPPPSTGQLGGSKYKTSRKCVLHLYYQLYLSGKF